MELENNVLKGRFPTQAFGTPKVLTFLEAYAILIRNSTYLHSSENMFKSLYNAFPYVYVYVHVCMIYMCRSPKTGCENDSQSFFYFSLLSRRGRELTVGCSSETALNGVIFFFFLLTRQPIVVANAASRRTRTEIALNQNVRRRFSHRPHNHHVRSFVLAYMHACAQFA